MTKAWKGLLPIASGAAIGVALFYGFGFFTLHYAGAVSTTGLPLHWKVYGTGFPMPPNNLNFTIDLVFWLAGPIILLEILARRVAPHFARNTKGLSPPDH